VLLLLALPVLAGTYIQKIIPPALNLAKCWKLVYIYEYMRQSAENFKHLDIKGIFRDYTLKSIHYENNLKITYFHSNYAISKNGINLNKDKNQDKEKVLSLDKRYFNLSSDYKQPLNLNPSFCSYLAGLIEGDGTIIVSKTERSKKGRLNYPSIQIAFDSRDFSLAMIIQSKLGCGSLIKTKGVNAYRLTINNYDGLILMVNILNGYMRTPKIEMFFLLIKFLNNRFPNLNINPKNKDLSSLDNNE
jgi:hypothetical protein